MLQRRRQRPWPALRVAVSVLGFAWISEACSSPTATGHQPEAALARDANAQREFRELREQWVGTAPEARVALEGALAQLVQRYPNEPQSRWTRIYLAWISVQQGRLADAERWLALAEGNPAGAAADLLEVVRASLLLKRGDAAEAYDQLLALQGRIIDADDRLLCLDQLVDAALADHRYSDALKHTLELAALAARRHRERVWRTLEPRLDRVPTVVLEKSLRTISSASIDNAAVRPAERAAATTWMRRKIREILSRSAISQRDVGLAQRLVSAPSRGETDRAPDSRLLMLATQGGVVPRAVGRTLGFALQLDDPITQQRSLEVAAGIALTLDLAAAGREQGVVLQTRAVEAGDGGMLDALARLAGDGATLLAAGLDTLSAREAAKFASLHGIPVLLLFDPELADQALPQRAYVVGTSPALANAALDKALSRRSTTITRVGGGQTPCPDLHSSDPTRRHIDPNAALGAGSALLFAGDADCARNVLMDLAGKLGRLTLGVGLDALSIVSEPLAGHDVWAVSAGHLPLFAASDGDEVLKRWRSSKRRLPSWYEALGHDVALLSQQSVPVSLSDGESEQAVSDLHQQVAKGLAAARLGQLWTTSAQGLSDNRRLIREFQATRIRPSAAKAE